MSDVASVREERQRIYGDPWENHKGIGKQWGALLRHVAKDIANGGDVPPSIVAACMAALKLNRARVPGVHHKDNSVDCIAYAQLMDEFRERELREAGSL